MDIVLKTIDVRLECEKKNKKIIIDDAIFIFLRNGVIAKISTEKVE